MSANRNKRGMASRHKQSLAVIILVSLLMLLMTGCQAIRETFGKEYRMIDDFFEQLESDVRFTFEDFAAIRDFTEEQRSYIDTQLNVLISNLKVGKANMKLMVRYLNENTADLDNESLEAHLEQSLLEARMEMERQIKEGTNGQFVLKSTDVDRGFFGSIWHFIRNHWLIALVILGIIGTIVEKLEEFRDWILNRKKGGNE